MIQRKTTRAIYVGTVGIGGNHPIAVQSMTNTDTSDVPQTVAQIKRLEAAGCEIIRLAVPDMKAAAAIREIRAHSAIPVIADIHFDYRLAIAAMGRGQQPDVLAAIARTQDRRQHPLHPQRPGSGADQQCAGRGDCD